MMSALLISNAGADSSIYLMCIDVCEKIFLICIEDLNCGRRFPLPIPQQCMEERVKCLRQCDHICDLK